MADTTSKRPRLLTVLCVLSFIYCGVLMINGVVSAFTDLPRKNIESAKARYEDVIEQLGQKEAARDPMVRFMEGSIRLSEQVVEHAKPLGYAWITVAIVSGGGTWLMWNLRRAGFIAYVLAMALSTAAKSVYLGSDSLFANVNSIVSVLVGAAFVVLYATQLKHMR